MPETKIAQRHLAPNYALTVYSLLGGVIKAESITGNLTNISASVALVDLRVLFIAVYLPVAATITGVKWWQNVAGAYTADQYNGVGVYSISGGTLTLIEKSTDDGNIWKATSATLASKALATTQALAPGVYFVGMLYNNSAQTTAPSIGCHASVSNLALQSGDFTNSVKMNSFLASQTALPSSQAMSGLTAIVNSHYAALY